MVANNYDQLAGNDLYGRKVKNTHSSLSVFIFLEGMQSGEGNTNTV